MSGARVLVSALALTGALPVVSQVVPPVQMTDSQAAAMAGSTRTVDAPDPRVQVVVVNSVSVRVVPLVQDTTASGPTPAWVERRLSDGSWMRVQAIPGTGSATR